MSAAPELWAWLQGNLMGNSARGVDLGAAPGVEGRGGSATIAAAHAMDCFRINKQLTAPRPFIVGDDAGAGNGDVTRSLYERLTPGVRGREMAPPLEHTNPNGWVLAGPDAVDRESPTAILFRMVSFDTAFGEPRLDPRLVVVPGKGVRYSLVQFAGPVHQEWKQAVAARGFEFVTYVANYAFVIRSTQDPYQLLSLPAVRWVGPYHPAYKFNEFTATIGEEFPAEIRIFPGVDPGPALWELDRIGLRYDIEIYNDPDFGTIVLSTVDPGQIAPILHIPDVDMIDHHPRNELHNYSSARQMRANRAWSQYRNSLGRNLTGKGQLIGYLDTGVDTGVAATTIGGKDFTHYEGATETAKIASIANSAACVLPGSCQTIDVCGHGTAGAGAAVGSGRLSEQGRGLNATDEEYYYAFAGSAPQARLVVRRAGGDAECSNFNVSASNDWSSIYTAGAKIINNSWGPVPGTCSYTFTCGGAASMPTFGSTFSAYSGNAITGDQFVTGSTVRMDGLLVNSAGNQGSYDTSSKGSSSCGWNPYGYGTSGGNAVAKNSLSVGAAEHLFLDRDDQQGEVAWWSSKGPTAFGMSKPDVVANGSWSHLPRTSGGATYDISTCNGTGPVAFVGGECANWGFPEARDIMNADNNLANSVSFPAWDYMFTGGTSFSSPFVAGAAAVVRQYLVDQDGITNPQGTLIKALLISGARDLGYGFMSCNASPTNAACNVDHLQNGRNVQGWGEVDLKNSLFPDPPRSMGYQDVSGTSAGVTTGSQNDFTISVTDSSVPLKVNLVWADIAGASGCTNCLVNNLRLIVIGPSQTYYGNNFTGSWSNTGTYNDDRNVVESVYIQNPATGTWTFRVYGTNIPTMIGGFTAYPYSLVYSGGFGAYGTAGLAPNRAKFPAIVERTVPAEPRVLEVGNSMIYGLRIYNFGSTSDTITLSRNQTVPTAAPTDFTVGFSPSGPAYSIASGAYQDVTVTITAPGTMTDAQLQRYDMHFRATSATTSIADTVALGFSLQKNPTALVADGYYSQRYPDAAVGPDGTLYAVFQSDEKLPDQAAPSTFTGSNTHYLWTTDQYTTAHVLAAVMFTYSTNGGQTWSTPEQISATSAVHAMIRPKVAVDTNNNVVAAWLDDLNLNVYARVRPGGAAGTWGSITNPITTTGYCADTGTAYIYSDYDVGLVADNAGNTLLFYNYAAKAVAWNNVLSLQIFNGSTWGSRIAITNPTGNVSEFWQSIETAYDSTNNRIWVAGTYYVDIDAATVVGPLGAVYGVAPYAAANWSGASGGTGGTTINPRVTAAAIANRHLLGIGCGAGQCFIGYAAGVTKQTNESWYQAQVAYQTASGSPTNWAVQADTYGTRIAWFNYSDLYPEPNLAYDASANLIHMVIPNRKDPQADYQVLDCTSTPANHFAAAGTTCTTVAGGAVWAQPEKILYMGSGCSKVFSLQDFYRDEAGPTRNGGIYVTDIGTCSVPCPMTVDVTPNAGSVCTGANIVFTATPTGGTGPYTYQWTRDGGDIAGQTSSTHTANYATAQSHTYNCKVTDTSNAACVNIIDATPSTGAWVAPPTVDVTPNGTTSACVNANIVFTATPSGGTAPYSYQWTQDGADIVGQTGSTLTRTFATAQSHTYNCKVASTGCVTTAQDGTASTGTWVAPPTSVDVTPNGTTSVATGNNIVFTATVTGGATPLYQWTEDGADIVGQTSSTLTRNYATAQSHTYNCKVNNTGCATTVQDVTPSTGIWTAPLIQVNSVTLISPNVCGDNDAYVEPGERWTVRVQLINNGNVAATAVVASLTENAGSQKPVTITGNPGAYSDMAVAATATVDYLMEVDSAVDCVKNIILDVTSIASTGYTFASEMPAITIPVGAVFNESGTANPAAAQNNTQNGAYAPAFIAPAADSASVDYSFTYAAGGGPGQTLFGPDDDPFGGGNFSTGGGTSQTVAHCSHSDGYYQLNRNGSSALVSPISTVGYTNLHVTFDAGADNVNAVLYLDYSTDGTNYTNAYSRTGSIAWACAGTVDVTLPAGAEGQATLYIRFRCTSGAGNQHARFDYVSIVGDGSGGGTWDANVRTQLVSPDTTTTLTLKDYGTSETSPATHSVTAFYNTEGPGVYTLRIIENSGGTADITTSTLTVILNECDFTNCGVAAPGEVDTTTNKFSDKNTVAWAAVATATGYRVYRGIKGDLPNLLDATNDSCTKCDGVGLICDVTADDPSVPTDKLYWYLIAAYNGGGEGTVGNASSGPRVLNSTGVCP